MISQGLNTTNKLRKKSLLDANPERSKLKLGSVGRGRVLQLFKTGQCSKKPKGGVISRDLKKRFLNVVLLRTEEGRAM